MHPTIPTLTITICGETDLPLTARWENANVRADKSANGTVAYLYVKNPNDIPVALDSWSWSWDASWIAQVVAEPVVVLPGQEARIPVSVGFDGTQGHADQGHVDGTVVASPQGGPCP